MHTLSPPLFTSAPHNRLHFGEQKVPHAINKKLAKALHNSTKAMITVTFDTHAGKVARTPLVLRLLYMYTRTFTISVWLSMCLHLSCTRIKSHTLLPCDFISVNLTAALSTGIDTMSSYKFTSRGNTDVKLTESGNTSSKQLLVMPTE